MKQSSTASPLAQAALDCFAEPVIGPRDFARVRWLAMTSSPVLALRFFLNRAPSFPANHVANGFPCAMPRISLHPIRATKKGEAERRETRSNHPRRAARGAPLRDALASRRPTAALARETAGPQGSASGHASGDSPGRSILYGRLNREAETLRFSTGVTRAGKTNERLSPYREHLAHRS